MGNEHRRGVLFGSGIMVFAAGRAAGGHCQWSGFAVVARYPDHGAGSGAFASYQACGPI